MHHLAPDDAARIDDRRCCGAVFRSSMRGVEQQPRQHLLVMHRLRDVVDARQPGVGVAGRLRPASNSVSHTAELAAWIDEIEEAAADPADRRDFQFARADRLAEGRVAERFGAVQALAGIVDLEADGADRRAVA